MAEEAYAENRLEEWQHILDRPPEEISPELLAALRELGEKIILDLCSGKDISVIFATYGLISKDLSKALQKTGVYDEKFGNNPDSSLFKILVANRLRTVVDAGDFSNEMLERYFPIINIQGLAGK